MNRSIARIATASCAWALFACATAHAAFIPIANPDAAYTGATTRLDVTAPDFDVVPSLSDAMETVSFDIDLVALTVPATWASWGSPPATESATPRVLWTGGFTTLAMDLAAPATTFGFEAQPNPLGPFSVTASFFHGATLIGSITRSPDGNASALLFAATSTTDVFDRVELATTQDFAIANVRYALARAVPEPGSITLMLLGGAAMGLGLRRRRRDSRSSAR